MAGFVSPLQSATTPLVNAGDDTVYLVGKNSAGTWQSTNSPTVSKTWSISVAGPLEISAIHGATFTLQFAAQAGQTYTVQYRNSLTTGTWQKLVDVSAPITREIKSIPDTPANFSSRFYRVVTPAQPD